MSVDDALTEQLLRRVAEGDVAATGELLARHRDRLRNMVALRMDPRLLARLDASDVVQETLGEAVRKLPQFLEKRPIPFYPWLRQLAWERLIDLARQHIHAQRRSVNREEPLVLPLADRSAVALADRLLASGTSPSGRMRKDEVRRRVRSALNGLAHHDREVLVLRYVEQLSASEMAAVLGITERGVRSRHRRALERLRDLMGDELAEQ